MEESNFNFRYVGLCDLDILSEKVLHYLQAVETVIRCLPHSMASALDLQCLPNTLRGGLQTRMDKTFSDDSQPHIIEAFYSTSRHLADILLNIDNVYLNKWMIRSVSSNFSQIKPNLLILLIPTHLFFSEFEGNISKMPDLDAFSLWDIKKRNKRSHGKRKNGNFKRKHKTVLSLFDLNILLNSGTSNAF